MQNRTNIPAHNITGSEAAPVETAPHLEFCEYQQISWTSNEEASSGTISNNNNWHKSIGNRVWNLLKLPFLSFSHKRLSSIIAAYDIEYTFKSKLTDSEKAAINVLISKADRSLKNYDTMSAWSCYNAAKRLEIFGYDDEALIAQARIVLEEANQKLSGWRKDAVKSLLCKKEQNAKDGNELLDKLTHFSVYKATSILQEHFDNTYLKLATTKGHMIFLVIIAVLAMSIWVFGLDLTFLNASSRFDPTSTKNVNTYSLATDDLIYSVILFGLLGAATSGFLTLSKSIDNVRIPEQLFNIWGVIARLGVGSVNALISYIFIAAGGNLINGIKDIQPPYILAIAFVAGFSERLVMGTVEKISNPTK